MKINKNKIPSHYTILALSLLSIIIPILAPFVYASVLNWEQDRRKSRQQKRDGDEFSIQLAKKLSLAGMIILAVTCVLILSQIWDFLI